MRPLLKISELRTKEVISVLDGKRLGLIGDLEIDLLGGRVKGIVIPAGARFSGCLAGTTISTFPRKKSSKSV